MEMYRSGDEKKWVWSKMVSSEKEEETQSSLEIVYERLAYAFSGSIQLL